MAKTPTAQLVERETYGTANVAEGAPIFPWVKGKLLPVVK
jgi:hypothetical protein